MKNTSTGTVEKSWCLRTPFNILSNMIVTLQPGILILVQGDSCFPMVSLSFVLFNLIHEKTCLFSLSRWLNNVYLDFYSFPTYTDDAGTLLSFFCHFNLLSSHVDDHSLSVASYGNEVSTQQSKKQFQYCSVLGLLLEVICKNTKRTLYVSICYANTYTAFTCSVPLCRL